MNHHRHFTILMAQISLVGLLASIGAWIALAGLTVLWLVVVILAVGGDPE